METTDKPSAPFIILSTQDKAIIIITLFLGVNYGRYYGIVYWDSGMAGAILGCVIGISANLILLPLKNWIAEAAISIYGGRRALWSLREQLEGDLNQVKHYKMQKKYDKALFVVNNVLKQDPEFPEAFYIKAQILWEGFKNAEAAKANCKKAMDFTPKKNEPIFRWASSLYKELTLMPKRQKTHLSINEE